MPSWDVAIRYYLEDYRFGSFIRSMSCHSHLRAKNRFLGAVARQPLFLDCLVCSPSSLLSLPCDLDAITTSSKSNHLDSLELGLHVGPTASWSAVLSGPTTLLSVFGFNSSQTSRSMVESTMNSNCFLRRTTNAQPSPNRKWQSRA
jgi:hypothetical protein